MLAKLPNVKKLLIANSLHLECVLFEVKGYILYGLFPPSDVLVYLPANGRGEAAAHNRKADDCK